MREWETEYDLDTEVVHHQIATRFPDLAGESVIPLGSDWDNAAFLVGGWVFRFPRRPFGGNAMRVETRLLPRIASSLPVAIPVPERLGAPFEQCPWGWTGYRAILVGVIDWGDLHAGDRAVDLGIAWSFLPAGARGAFRAADGPISEGTWSRARYRSFH